MKQAGVLTPRVEEGVAKFLDLPLKWRTEEGESASDEKRHIEVSACRIRFGLFM